MEPESKFGFLPRNTNQILKNRKCSVNINLLHNQETNNEEELTLVPTNHSAIQPFICL